MFKLHRQRFSWGPGWSGPTVLAVYQNEDGSWPHVGPLYRHLRAKGYRAVLEVAA